MEQNSNINRMQLLIPNSLNQAEEYQTEGAGRLAWLGRWLYEPKVAGSSPARPTSNLQSELELCLSNNHCGVLAQDSLWLWIHSVESLYLDVIRNVLSKNLFSH